MVELLWGRVDDPLRCAVVGIEACRRIRRQCFSGGRGRASAKRLLETMISQLEVGVVGVLDNIAKPRVGRALLLDRNGTLGCQRGASNLLKLGIRLRCRELVAHDLSQGILDNQWRGADPMCGTVCIPPLLPMPAPPTCLQEAPPLAPSCWCDGAHR